ncbi:MAG: response regulator transcription factor [Candidatus Limnocylindrales bacterium]
MSSAVAGQPPPTGEPSHAGEAAVGGPGTPVGGPGTAVGGPLKILVADDEPAMVGVIGAILGAAGHRIIAAYDGREAIRRFEEEHPDLVLLDLAMPGVDGADVCRRIRAAGDTPIIVVSGESDLGVTVELLDAGADDYVRKPFRAAELLARTRSVVRRHHRTPARDGWLVDRARHEISWRGRALPLTVTEFRLVARLIDRLGEVVDRRDLLAYAWPGVHGPDPLWLKPHMARLRRKLIAVGAPVPVPIRAIGYRLDDPVGDGTVATPEPEPTPGRPQP